VVAEDQLSLAIGKRGQNVRLAARLTGWDVDILTPAEYNKNIDDMEKAFKEIDVDDLRLEKMVAMGMVSLMDVEEVGTEPLVNELGVDEELAQRIVETAAEGARRIAAERKAAQEQAEREQAEAEEAAAAEQAAEGEPAEPSAETPQDGEETADEGPEQASEEPAAAEAGSDEPADESPEDPDESHVPAEESVEVPVSQAGGDTREDKAE
jgi:N utilization substance protein A